MNFSTYKNGLNGSKIDKDHENCIKNKKNIIIKNCKNIISIIEFHKKHGRFPREKCKNEEERFLGQFLSHLRRSKKGGGEYKWYDIYYKVASKYSYEYMFNTINFKEKILEDIKLIGEFYHTNKKYPSQHSKDEHEKRIGKCLSNLRSAKQGKINIRWLKDYDDMAIYINCNNMFEYEDVVIRNIKLIVEFYRNNHKLPTTTSKNNLERKLGKRLSRLRANREKICKEYRNILDQYKDIDILCKVDHKQNSINDIKAIIAFNEKYGRFPSTTALDEEEKRLGLKRYTLKKVYRNNGKKRIGIWYPEFDEYVHRLGM